MSDQFDQFVDSLIADQTPIPTKKTDPKCARRQFVCEGCGGTGRWRGGQNRHGNSKCNTCHGLGYLVTSPEVRAKARLADRTSRANKFKAAQDASLAHGNGALIKFLEENREWNEFCASLLTQHQEGRILTEKQVDAARRMWVKLEEKRREKKLERELAVLSAPRADCARIREMFDTALVNGKKQRALHAGNFNEAGELTNKVVLTPARAPRTEIWVKVDDEFVGGIKDDGAIDLRRNAPEWVAKVLQRIAANPDEECRLYGRRTGVCSCCGRELTNKISIDLGIGPICRSKWGLA